MPKLNKKVAQETAQAEAWGNGPRLLPEGRYAGRLMAVTESDKPGPSGFHQWSWRFTQLHTPEGENLGGNQFLNTSLSPKARGGLKQAFDAFGYTTDSDTDEMLGEWAVLYITQEVAQQGAKAGQTVNRVQSIAEFDPDEWDFDPEEVPADKPRSGSGDATGAGGGGDSF